MKLALSPLFNLSVYTLGFFCAANKMALAQVTSDVTVNTQVTQDGNIAEITGGEARGGNLFHSFQDFSVPTGNEAFFNNANDISNIFSRVTGGNISNIDGAIRANGSANLFLINPAGIIFGENARLDIGGSFLATTASSLLFEDGEFSAVDLDNPPLLTINAPIGLGFRDNPGDIALQNSNLEISQGQDVSLIGGEISLDGSNVSASQGTVNLGAVSAFGTIALNTNFDFDFENISLGDISIKNGSTVNVNGAGGGNIMVNANNLTLSEASIFNAGINSNNSTAETLGGNIVVNASGAVALESGSLFRNNLNTNGSGTAGDISITAQNLSLTDNSDLSTTTDGNGNAGNINLSITDEIVLDGAARIKSQVLENGVGNGGDVQVNSNSINLNNNSLLIADVIGQGDGGNIQIDSNFINLDNNSLFLADIKGIGNGGDIDVIADTLILRERSSFSTGISGQGDGGNITVNALTDVILEGSSFLSTRVRETGEGSGGDIKITTTNLSLEGKTRETRSNIITGSVGVGDAGDIIINASGSIILNQHSTINNKASERSGNSGDTTINSDRLILNEDSLILNDNGNPELSVVNNIGNSGNITINSRIIVFDNLSGIGNSSYRSAIGEAGDININTDSLTIAGGSNISSLTENDSNGGEININARSIDITTGGTIASLTGSSGNAGNITLNVIDRIAIDGESPLIPSEDSRSTVRSIRELEPFTGLFANASNTSSGNGGNIQIFNPQALLISNGGEISVDNQGSGNGGNLSVTADSLELNNQSQIVAETEFGQEEQQPSNINLLIDDTLILRGDSLISASALNNANGGNVNIDTKFVLAFPAQAGGNDIIANAKEGSGGNISIDAESLFGIQEGNLNDLTNDINASSEVSGLDGTINITTPDINPVQGATELPSNVVELGETTQQACRVSKESAAKNRLYIIGKGGISPSPDLPLNSENILIDGQTTTASAIPQPIHISQSKIQPARGIEITESGAIILTAHSTNNLGERLSEGKINCGV